MANEQMEHSWLREVLGYFNFSSGTRDPKFLAALNELFRLHEPDGRELAETADTIHTKLLATLDTLAAESSAFAHAVQAKGVLELVFKRGVNEYLSFHRDLLFHQNAVALRRPFFLGRFAQAVLSQEGPWEELDRILKGAITSLNDFIGHRPIAVLNSGQQMQPFPHEWVRPVPIYIEGAGIAAGRYAPLIEQALAILKMTDPPILEAAQFQLDRLEEFAYDPRAYDFDHPVNKRANYQFGQWDPHCIDEKGFYRRFVAQQMVLDALLSRVEQNVDLPRSELLFEAGAALAGTILMSSGTSGYGPGAHDSSVTLLTLLPRIAAYRDRFYHWLLSQVPEPHRQRLMAEATVGKQPFAGARQHLNQALAQRRARQLQHVELAGIFSRIGYPEAARRQAVAVPVASARIKTEIRCQLMGAQLASQFGRLTEGAAACHEIEQLIHRGIECGGLVDPWNILGFQGNFSLFPAPENSVVDHRIDELEDLLRQFFDVLARIWSEASAHQNQTIATQMRDATRRVARWWDQFGSTSVEGEGFSGREAYESAELVAKVLSAWHEAGAASGNLGFWRSHVGDFQSPKSYALVAEALLDQKDHVAAMALLVQWASRADELPLADGELGFHYSARRWLVSLLGTSLDPPSAEAAQLVLKFFDFLEANAEAYWDIPTLTLEFGPSVPDEEWDEEEEDENNLYGAAYEGVVYSDTTDDGQDADMLESGPTTEYELEGESRRIRDRLAFLETLARSWDIAAVRLRDCSAEVVQRLLPWRDRAQANANALGALLDQVARQKLPEPTASRESLMEFDRRRHIRDALLETIISTFAATSLAADHLSAICGGVSSLEERLWQAIFRSDVPGVRKVWPEYLVEKRAQTLLYIPLGRGGSPRKIAAVRKLHQSLRLLAMSLPRLGMFCETWQLLTTARDMEISQVVGGAAVSEFDRLFNAGHQALVTALVTAAKGWPSHQVGNELLHTTTLVECLEQLTECSLKQWLAHSRTLRLSVLERIDNEETWQDLTQFIQRYGRDLLTQGFLNFGNLRAILHQGAATWLQRWLDEPLPDDAPRLLQELGKTIKLTDAANKLELVLEAIVENYPEYRDYNSTTTQSDRGDLLYLLLSFLRLRVYYDRIAWHLQPVLTVHEVLVRNNFNSAAERWRRSMAERTSEIADRVEQRLADLQRSAAMRLPSVADRVSERFTRPLQIDRMRALIEPAMNHAQLDPKNSFFASLEEEANELCKEPHGSGLDLPDWLASLREEVDQVREQQALSLLGIEPAVAPRPLSPRDFLREVRRWDATDTSEDLDDSEE